MTTSSTKADKIIMNHVWFAAVPGFFPIPIVDIAGITAVQLDMIKQLCKHYDKPYNEERGKSIITALLGTVASRIPAYGARSLLKTIPVVGWVVGGITLSAFAATSTYSTGRVFKAHFEEGGTLNDINPTNFKKFYEEEFAVAKKRVKEFFDPKNKPTQGEE